mmetsp:Transcript_122807/g.306715  ORF Transcript_122807/g.306715 Transcript_122807/m.306715 type:complete len:98 (+) Transcript_122807:175-468(+)
MLSRTRAFDELMLGAGKPEIVGITERLIRAAPAGFWLYRRLVHLNFFFCLPQPLSLVLLIAPQSGSIHVALSATHADASMFVLLHHFAGGVRAKAVP